jgi:hypothetical protein
MTQPVLPIPPDFPKKFGNRIHAEQMAQAMSILDTDQFFYVIWSNTGGYWLDNIYICHSDEKMISAWHNNTLQPKRTI